MKLSLASTAELYREHRRTQSRRKKERIAGELQRRHDEQNCPPGMFPRDRWFVPNGEKIVRTPMGPRVETVYYSIRRYEFAIML
jgi:hypothetical protein